MPTAQFLLYKFLGNAKQSILIISIMLVVCGLLSGFLEGQKQEDTKRHEETLGAMGMFTILIVVMVLWV